MTASEWRPTVVGIDGSESALDAVRWATAQGGPVRLVAAVGPAPFQALGPQAFGQESYRAAALTSAKEHIQTATGLAAQALPMNRISTEVRAGAAAEVLQDESRHAPLLVVGNRGRGGFRGLLLGSTGVALAATSRCPLVVVRGRPAPEGPIVVGVDDSPDSEAALGFAFEAAAERGVPLTAVRAWGDPVMEPASAVLIDRAESTRTEGELLDRTLAGWRTKFPAVEVRTLVAHGVPAAALIEESGNAGLVVVGSRGRGGLAGLLLGSVSQSLLHHAACSVAIVRAGNAGTVER